MEKQIKKFQNLLLFIPFAITISIVPKAYGESLEKRVPVATVPASGKDFVKGAGATGELEFSIPLVSIGELGLRLSYSSNGVAAKTRTENQYAPSGFVGIGWNLFTGSIAGEINNNADPSDDRYFYTAPDGSYELQQDATGAFRIPDYKPWKIQRMIDSGGRIVGWIITKEDGTTFRFGHYNISAQSFSIPSPNPDTSATRCLIGYNGLVVNVDSSLYSDANLSLIPYQWDLSDIQDIYGNHTTVNYRQTQQSLTAPFTPSYTTTLKYTRESHPNRIRDGRGGEIEFVQKVMSVIQYYNYPQTYLQNLFEKTYLDSVYIKRNGVIFQKIGLGYDTTDALCTGVKKRFLSTLLTSDGNTNLLPSIKFDYYYSQGDINPGTLKSVTDPQGGKTVYDFATQSLPNITLSKTDSVNQIQYWNSALVGRVPNNDGLAGTDFIVVRSNDNHAKIFRQGPKGWYLETVFTPAMLFHANPNSSFLLNLLVYNNYIIFHRNTDTNLVVAKRTPSGWMLYDLTTEFQQQLGTSLKPAGIIGAGENYFVVKYNYQTTPNIYNWNLAIVSLSPQGLDVNALSGTYGELPLIAPDATSNGITFQGFCGQNYLVVRDLVYDSGIQWYKNCFSHFKLSPSSGNWETVVNHEFTNNWYWSKEQIVTAHVGKNFVLSHKIASQSGSPSAIKVYRYSGNSLSLIEDYTYTIGLPGRSPSLVVGDEYYAYANEYSGQLKVVIKTWDGHGFGSVLSSSLYSGTVGNGLDFPSLSAFGNRLILSWSDNNWDASSIENRKLAYTTYSPATKQWSSITVIDNMSFKYTSAGSFPDITYYMGRSPSVGLSQNMFATNWYPENPDNGLQTTAYLRAYEFRGNSVVSAAIDQFTLRNNSSGMYEEADIWVMQPGAGFLALARTGRQSITDLPPDSIGAYIISGAPGGTLQFKGNPTVAVLNKRTVYSGMGESSVYSYTYENGSYNEHLTTQFNKVTETPPGNIGKIVTYFYNDLGSGQAEEFINAVNYKELDGLPYKIKEYSSTNTLVKETQNTWAANGVDSINGVFHTKLRSEGVYVDNIWHTTLYEYNNTNYQVSKITEVADAASNLSGSRNRVTEITYGYQANAAMQTKNMLVQPAGKATYAVRSSQDFLSVYADGSNTLNRKQFTVAFTQTVNWTVQVGDWAHFYIGTWLGGNNIVSQTSYGVFTGSFTANPGYTYYIEAAIEIPDVFYVDGSVSYYSGGDPLTVLISRDTTLYDNNGLPLVTKTWDGTNWITTSTVASRNNPYGFITESDNVDNVRTLTLYGYNSTVPVATAVNANLSQLLVDEFGDGNFTGSGGPTWVITDINNDGDTQWLVENGMLKQINYASAENGECDRILYDHGSGISGVTVFEFDVRIADSDWWDFTITAGGYNWFGDNGGPDCAIWTAINNETWYYYNNTQGWVVIQSGLVVGKTYHLKIVANGPAMTADYYVDGVRMVSGGENRTSTSSFQKIAFGNYGYSAATNATWYIDNVRLYPAGALVTSSSYDPVTLQATTTTDASGISTYYDYDSFGRLIATKNTDKTIVSQNRYYYSREINGGAFSSNDPNFSETVTYPQGISTNGLVGFWTLEGDALDEANSNNGIVIGATATRGSFGKALSFNGFAYVNVSDIGSNPLDAIGPALTMGAWVYPTTTGGSMIIINKESLYEMALNSGRFQAAIATPGWEWLDFGVVPLNQWSYVVITYDGSYIKGYINGTLMNSYGKTGIIPVNNQDFRIGARGGDATPDSYFTGKIDEVKVYARALSLNEILSEYNFSRTTAYTDGMGRTLQSQTREGVNDLISAVEYDAAGRAYRNWRTYSYNTNHAYDANATASSRATEVFGISNPYSETIFYPDPLSRVQTSKIVGRTIADEDINYSYGSAFIEGQPCRYVETQKRLASTTVWVPSRTYTDRLGRTVKTTSGSNEIVDSARYTMLGLPYRTIDPKGYLTTNTYNFLGRLTETNNPDEGISKYIYDKAGRLRFMVDAVGIGSSKILYWKYDGLGRVIEKGWINGTWGDGSSYQTIANSSPSWPSTPATWRKQYTYESGGRLSAVYTNNDDASDNEVEEYFTYDKFGNASQKGIKVYDYNSSTTYNTGYGFDLLGRVTSIAYPSGSMNAGYSYDMAGRITQVTGYMGAVVANYTYNNKGEMLTEGLNNGAQTRTYSYNNKGLLTGIGSSSFYTETLNPTNLAGTTYYHGLIGGINTSYGFSTPTPPSPYLQDFVYDKYGRLTQADASSSWSEQRIGMGGATQYDVNGNITLLRRGSTTRNYKYENGKNTIDSVGSWNYTSNATGNIISSGSIGGNWTISHDPFTQMQMQYTQSGQGVYLQYDGKKERVYKQYTNQGGANVKTLYVHGFNDYPLYVKDNSNEWFYVYGPTGLIAVGVNSASNLYYVHKDHLGSTKLVTNSSGGVVCRYEYDPYGKIVDAYVSPQVKYLFTGQEQEADVSSSFWNFRARGYDSEIGLFYATDPKKQTHSPYSYAGGNPIIFIDPTGRAWYYSQNGTFLGDDGENNKDIYTINEDDLERSLDEKKKKTDWKKVRESKDSKKIGVFGDFVDMNGKTISSEELKQSLVGFSLYMKDAGITDAYSTITVTGGDRLDQQKNKSAGGVSGSRHLHGDAADINVVGMTREDLADAARDYGVFGTVIFYNEKGNTQGFGYHHQKMEMIVSFEGDEIRIPYTERMKNTYDKKIGPHIHVDMAGHAVTILRKYAGFDPTIKNKDGTFGTNTYKPWYSRDRIR